MVIVLVSFDLRVIRNIFGVKYHFAVRFPICHVYNKLKDKQILLYSSLGMFFIKKEAAFDKHEINIFYRKKMNQF